MTPRDAIRFTGDRRTRPGSRDPAPIRSASGDPAHPLHIEGVTIRCPTPSARISFSLPDPAPVVVASSPAILGLSVLSVGAGAMLAGDLHRHRRLDRDVRRRARSTSRRSPTVAFTVTGMMPGDTNTQALTIANAGTATFRYAMSSDRDEHPRHRP